MKVSAIFLLSVISCACAAILCPPNFCDSMLCEEVTSENCEGRVQEGGSVCGCCDSCIAQIPLGVGCHQTMLLGLPATSECEQGSKCDFQSMTCIAKTCAELKEEQGNMLADLDKPLLGAHLPECEADGSWSARQCTGSKCYCVDEAGKTIEGFGAKIWEAKDMTCACARHQNTEQPQLLGAFVPRCDPMGNYAPVQCHGSVCSCADSAGQLLAGTEVSIADIATLTC
ncbi:nidogen-2-like [Branchiostoma lanceolatum]|uniref:nidogen-2-like n=1 Tax=Branchiostoma lanceolatum TaxID=7740 RepID=UPI003452FA19